MSGTAAKSCGQKHLELLAIILGGVLVVCGAVWATCTSSVAAIESRTRVVEQGEAANAARFDAIQKSLERLERQQGAKP